MDRILIVDDQEAIRSMLAVVFSKAGYKVRIAAHATEAIAILATESVDVILSDVMMPAMSGHDLVRWVFAHRPAVLCVLMTGSDETNCDSCPFAAGCTRLNKPFNGEEAVAAVAEAVRKRSR
jgi:CheY-like chemotaxis protein